MQWPKLYYKPVDLLWDAIVVQDQLLQDRSLQVQNAHCVQQTLTIAYSFKSSPNFTWWILILILLQLHVIKRISQISIQMLFLKLLILHLKMIITMALIQFMLINKEWDLMESL